MIHSWNAFLVVGRLACVLRLGFLLRTLELWFEVFKELFHGRNHGHSDDLMGLLLVSGA